MSKIFNSRGLTLIEVISSIVIIAIILISFFSLFLQSKKTNVSAEGIQDATYEAQKVMEQLYNVANKPGSIKLLDGDPILITSITSFTKSSGEIRNACPTGTKEEVGYEYKNNANTEPFKMKLIISSVCDYENTAKVLIEVIDKNTDKLKAQIENVYILNP